MTNEMLSKHKLHQWQQWKKQQHRKQHEEHPSSLFVLLLWLTRCHVAKRKRKGGEAPRTMYCTVFFTLIQVWLRILGCDWIEGGISKIKLTLRACTANSLSMCCAY